MRVIGKICWHGNLHVLKDESGKVLSSEQWAYWQKKGQKAGEAWEVEIENGELIPLRRIASKEELLLQAQIAKSKKFADALNMAFPDEPFFFDGGREHRRQNVFVLVKGVI